MTSATAVLASLLTGILALSACGTSPSKAREPSGSSRPLSTKSLEVAMQAVPAEATGVVSMAAPTEFGKLLLDFGVPMGQSLVKEYSAAVRAHLNEHIGVELGAVSSAVVAVFGNESGLAIVYPVSGELKDGVAEGRATFVRSDGEDFVYALHGRHLLIGEMVNVRSAIATLEGGKSILDSGELGSFVQEQTKGAYFCVAGDLRQLPVPPEFKSGLRYAAIRVTPSGLRGTLRGENAALVGLEQQLKALVAMGLQQGKAAMEGSAEQFDEGLGAIAAYYNMRALAEFAKPVVSGEEMTLDVPLSLGGSGSFMLAGGIGATASVAIPAFLKYLKKSKAVEASMNLKRISDGIRVHYAETGALPASVAATPLRETCCNDAGEGEKCVANQAFWQHPTWQKIGFSIPDPHHYVYELQTDANSFTALAYGDLDCDGVYSTHALYGAIVEGELMVAGDVIKQSPLE